MITYSKGFPAPLTLVWRLYGASTGRALPFAALATLATCSKTALLLLNDTDMKHIGSCG